MKVTREDMERIMISMTQYTVWDDSERRITQWGGDIVQDMLREFEQTGKIQFDVIDDPSSD